MSHSGNLHKIINLIKFVQYKVEQNNFKISVENKLACYIRMLSGNCVRYLKIDKHTIEILDLLCLCSNDSYSYILSLCKIIILLYCSIWTLSGHVCFLCQAHIISTMFLFILSEIKIHACIHYIIITQTTNANSYTWATTVVTYIFVPIASKNNMKCVNDTQ